MDQLNEHPERYDRRLTSAEGRKRYDAWQKEKREVEERLELIDAQTQILTRIMARNQS